MGKGIKPSLLTKKRKYDLKKIDDILRKGDAATVAQFHMNNLKLHAARIQIYVDQFIPISRQDSFYDALQEYSEWHDLIAITEMRRAVKGNAFAPAVEARAEEGNEAATISISMNAKHPGIKMKELIDLIRDERERVLGVEHRDIDRSTVHRHLAKVGESRRKRG